MPPLSATRWSPVAPRFRTSRVRILAQPDGQTRRTLACLRSACSSQRCPSRQQHKLRRTFRAKFPSPLSCNRELLKRSPTSQKAPPEDSARILPQKLSKIHSNFFGDRSWSNFWSGSALLPGTVPKTGLAREVILPKAPPENVALPVWQILTKIGNDQ